jgi:hypothetical protein
VRRPSDCHPPCPVWLAAGLADSETAAWRVAGDVIRHYRKPRRPGWSRRAEERHINGLGTSRSSGLLPDCRPSPQGESLPPSQQALFLGRQTPAHLVEEVEQKRGVQRTASILGNRSREHHDALAIRRHIEILQHAAS